MGHAGFTSRRSTGGMRQEVGMTSEAVRVGVNGYGVIGKRVADAITPRMTWSSSGWRMSDSTTG